VQVRDGGEAPTARDLAPGHQQQRADSLERFRRQQRRDAAIGGPHRAEALEATLDVDNLTNANWVWQVRTLTPATAFTDPTTGQRATLTQFLSPTAILPPRTVVLRAAYKF